jgi:hypothetical protein
VSTRPGPRRYAVLGLVVCLVACQDSLPGAPTDLQSGLIIYEHANYQGASAHITESVGNLDDFEGPCIAYDSSGGVSTAYDTWNECVSSVRLAPGWRATLYRDTGYDGDKLDVTGDIANLQLSRGDCDHDGFNDCTSSIRVFRN